MTPTEIITRLRQLQGCTGNPYYIEAIRAAIAVIKGDANDTD